MSITDSSSSVSRHPSAAAIVFGPFRFDRSNRILSRDGEEISLPPRVVAVLEFLLDRAGRIVSKDAILEGAWNGAFVSETSLTEAISQLRQALGDDSQSPAFIQTVHRRGYRFIAEVKSTGPPTAAPAAVDSESGVEEPPRTTLSPARFGVPIGIAVALIAALAAGWVLGRRTTAIPAAAQHGVPAVRLGIELPPNQILRTWARGIAISPDGRTIVYVAAIDDVATLFRRPIDQVAGVPIAGTEDATAPFFSPDGNWIGFFAQGLLRKIPLTGGTPVDICNASLAVAGTWGDDGTIVFSTLTPAHLMRVDANGGTPVKLLDPDPTRDEIGLLDPVMLPGSRVLLFTSWSNTIRASRIDALSLDSGARRSIVESAAAPLYAGEGFLVYSVPGGTVATPFDSTEARLTGAPVATIDDALTDPFTGFAQVALSNDGTLAYIPGDTKAANRELASVGRDGTSEPLAFPPRLYRNLEMAPDGRRFAATIVDGDRSDVWIGDLETGSLNRLTFDGFNIEPVWSPDGQWVAFAARHGGPYGVWRKRANGKGAAEQLLSHQLGAAPVSWSPDGRDLVCDEISDETGFDLWILHENEDGTWTGRPFIREPGQQIYGAISPDGRWFVYESLDGDTQRVFMTDYPAHASRWQISDAGWGVLWRPDGGAVQYLDGTSLIEVPVTFRPEPTFGKAQKLFERPDLVHVEIERSGNGYVVIHQRSIPTDAHVINVATRWLDPRAGN